MRLIKLPKLFVLATASYLLLAGCSSSAATASPAEPTATSTVWPAPSPSDTPSPLPPTITVEPTERPTRPPPIGKALDVELPEGDATRGEKLADRFHCMECHGVGIGPGFGSSGDRPPIVEKAELRIAQEDYTGKAVTGEQYLIESLTSPEIFEPEGWVSDMPGGFDESLSLQDMADLIAWLRTFE